RYTEVRVSGLPRFTCGAVGYLGYDAVRLIEHLPNQPKDDLGLPDAIWCFYHTIAAFDHVKHQLVLMSAAFVDERTELSGAYEAARERIERLETELSQPVIQSPERVVILDREMGSNFDRPSFETAVERRSEEHTSELQSREN